MIVEIEPDIARRIEDLVAMSEGIAPVSAESVVHIALEAFLEGAGV